MWRIHTSRSWEARHMASSEDELWGLQENWQEALRAGFKLMPELKREPNPEEIAQQAGLTSEQVEAALRARDELVLRHFYLVKFWVRKMAPSIHWVPTDDLKSSGTVGLIKAVDRFDPCRGNKFSTYARYWIRAEIWDSYDVNRGMSRNTEKVLRVIAILMEDLDHKPTVEEIAQKAELTPEKVEDALREIDICFAEQPPEIDEDSDESSFNVSDVTAINPETDAVNTDYLERLFSKLSDREAQILILTYWEDKNSSEIAVQLNLTETNIKVIRSRTLKKLGNIIRQQEGGEDYES